MGILGWSTTAMASRYTHLVTPIHKDVAGRLDGLLWAAAGAAVEVN
jgi:integrase